MTIQTIFILVTGLAAVIFLTVEVFLARYGLSATESSLFGVIQFIFSIGFAWALSKQSSQKSFQEQQRKFATAAFRRIKEIEVHNDMLKDRISRAMREDSSDYQHELDIACTLATAIGETTRSSKLDWADVIGEEIGTLDEIKEIQSRLSRQQASLSEDSDNIPDDVQSKVDQLRSQIERLKEELPKELQLLADQEPPSAYDILTKEYAMHGYLTLRGFADNEMDFDSSIDSLNIGDQVSVQIEDFGERVGSLIARDSSGKTIASFLNSAKGAKYNDFTISVCDVLGASSFSVTVTAVSRKPMNSGRRLFTAIAKRVKPKEVTQ